VDKKNKKSKFFVFSDESGSWHNPKDIYVRAWIVITEDEYQKLIMKVENILSITESNELSWSLLSGNKRFFNEFIDIDFRIFITLSSPKDINWNNKYLVTRKFEASMANFDFGDLESELVKYIKERIYRDIKNALFLHFYEKYHIENAKKAIEAIISPKKYDLIYRIDPPQMSRKGWKNVLHKIDTAESINLEFPKSNRSHGIQFADIVAGCFRSLLSRDEKIETSKEFFKQIEKNMIPKSRYIPNPNIIFFQEVDKEIQNNCKKIWENKN